MHLRLRVWQSNSLHASHLFLRYLPLRPKDIQGNISSCRCSARHWRIPKATAKEWTSTSWPRRDGSLISQFYLGHSGYSYGPKCFRAGLLVLAAGQSPQAPRLPRLCDPMSEFLCPLSQLRNVISSHPCVLAKRALLILTNEVLSLT